MNKYLVIVGVAVVVLLLSRAVQAKTADSYNPKNWGYLPGYKPGAGVMM